MTVGQTIESVVELDVGRIAVRRVNRHGPTAGTILLINGAIATASTARWAEKGLLDFDLVAFDFPNMGRSRMLNPDLGVVPKEDEARTVLQLIEAFRADHLISVSWGGTALLLALLERPARIRSAVVASFSFGVGPRLVALSHELLALSQTSDREAAARLIVDGLGEHLSAGLKRLYYNYFVTLDDVQMRYAVEQIRYVLQQSPTSYLERLKAIDIPVLFANGELDQYTPPDAVKAIAGTMPHAAFDVVPSAGHFLAVETREAQSYVVDMVTGFFLANGANSRAQRAA